MFGNGRHQRQGPGIASLLAAMAAMVEPPSGSHGRRPDVRVVDVPPELAALLAELEGPCDCPTCRADQARSPRRARVIFDQTYDRIMADDREWTPDEKFAVRLFFSIEEDAELKVSKTIAGAAIAFLADAKGGSVHAQQALEHLRARWPEEVGVAEDAIKGPGSENRTGRLIEKVMTFNAWVRSNAADPSALR